MAKPTRRWYQEDGRMNESPEGDYVQTDEMASAVRCLQDIAAMGRKAGSETARHWLHEHCIDCPNYETMT